MNRHLAYNEMNKRGIDALLASSPSNFFFTSSYHRILEFLPGLTITPLDPGIDPVIILGNLEEKLATQSPRFKEIRSYPVWTEIIDVEDFISGNITRVPKPCQHDIENLCTFVSCILREKGLDRGTLGVEAASMTHTMYSLLQAQNPGTRLVAADGIFTELQRVKTEDGIRALKAAADLGVKGIKGIFEGGVSGTTIGALHLRYKNAVLKEISGADALKFDFFNPIGIAAGDPFRSLGHAEYEVSKGDTLFVDCGVVFDGHMSDMGRTFVVGKANPMQDKIYNALRAGFDGAMSRMRPGVKLNDIFREAQETIRSCGLDWYSRGHFGHSVGIFPRGEQPPFICLDEESELEPNMVMCVETPLYVTGLGGFQIEDMVLITPDGHETLTDLSRDLVEL